MIYDKTAYLQGLKDTYAQEIREGLDFWAEHGIDWDKGGVVTYLDRDGNWYCDEKQGWFTGRAMYAFARAYSDVYPEPRWLAAAENLYCFMVKHQFDPETGKLYHNMNRDGQPIDSQIIPDVIYSAKSTNLHEEGFAVMGLSELYRATGRQDVKETLYRVLDMEVFLYRNPRYFIDGSCSPENKMPKPTLSSLMTLLCSIQTARVCDPERESYYTGLLAEFVDQVMQHYYDPQKKLLSEQDIDCPGHSMEVAWFMLAEGMYTNNQALISCCAEIIGSLFEMGWDRTHGGGFRLFQNLKETPAFSVLQNLKYWWPNSELEAGLMYAYIGTGDSYYLEKFRMVHEWIFAHFPDREHGEWFGYLNEYGQPISQTKGDNQKGPYHLYRNFCAIYSLLNTYLNQGTRDTEFK